MSRRPNWRRPDPYNPDTWKGVIDLAEVESAGHLAALRGERTLEDAPENQTRIWERGWRRGDADRKRLTETKR